MAVFALGAQSQQQVDPGRVHESQLPEVHDDDFDTLIPGHGVECALEQRHRRKIELANRRQTVNSTLARLAYRQRPWRDHAHLQTREGFRKPYGQSALAWTNPIPPQ